MQIDTFERANEIRNMINHYSKVIDTLSHTQCKAACLAAVSDPKCFSQQHIISYVKLPAELYDDMITVINERMIALEKQFTELQ